MSVNATNTGYDRIWGRDGRGRRGLFTLLGSLLPFTFSLDFFWHVLSRKYYKRTATLASCYSPQSAAQCICRCDAFQSRRERMMRVWREGNNNDARSWGSRVSDGLREGLGRNGDGLREVCVVFVGVVDEMFICGRGTGIYAATRHWHSIYSPRVCRNCMGSALYVDCVWVCVSSMCVRSGRLVYVGRPLKTLHTTSSALIGWTLRKTVNNTSWWGALLANQTTMRSIMVKHLSQSEDRATLWFYRVCNNNLRFNFFLNFCTTPPQKGPEKMPILHPNHSSLNIDCSATTASISKLI